MSKVTKFHGCSREEVGEFDRENNCGNWIYGTNAQSTRAAGVYITYAYTSEKMVMQGKPSCVEPMTSYLRYQKPEY